eukprot:TRINITY_DN54973_c0_g1_i1.p1 TRINITY_DN54973_c0_g1~~TRINITY_DN54973_c0_g1_i1.p1  ORF type:complete len:1170 (+),score=197.03 TRINITY_DN54973_c0_g1_i1:54-3563(+)
MAKSNHSQHVWIYCQEDEARDLGAFCRDCRRVAVFAHPVDPSKGGAREKEWRRFLNVMLTIPPPPYGSGDWAELLDDAVALLLASCAHKELEGRSEADGARSPMSQPRAVLRSPAVLVTDRPKLCWVSSDASFCFALTEAARLDLADILTVVMNTDFGMLCGHVMVQAPEEVCSSFLLQESSEAPVDECKSAHDTELPLDALYVQSPQLGSLLGKPTDDSAIGDEPTADAADAPGELDMYVGVRLLALFGDGRCFYSVVSCDGVRSVEASGQWEVINGFLVIRGTDGQADVTHSRLVGSKEIVELPSERYNEPIFISLQELASDFQPPIDLSQLGAQGRDRMRVTFLDRLPSLVGTGKDDADRENLLTTFVTTDAEQTIGSQPFMSSPCEDDGVGGCSREDISATSQHALMRIARATPTSPQPIDDGLRSASGSKSAMPGPRLLGLERGIAEDGADAAGLDFSESNWGRSSQCRRAQVSYDAICRLAEFAQMSRASVSDQGAKQVLTLAAGATSVRPGTYLIEPGQSENYLRIVLHACGRCEYQEMVGSSRTKALNPLVMWRVVGDRLLLCSQNGEPSFSLREMRGNRVVERSFSRIDIDVKVLLDRCRFIPFPQDRAPFLSHIPTDTSQRIFGVVDPTSPALLEMKCRLDRIPYHAFERQLRKHGLQCDEILSDFRFLDRDSDGQVVVSEVRLLDDYGGLAASPEIVSDLHCALVNQFGDLDAAFKAIALSETRFSAERFEEFLQNELPSDGEQLLSWVERTTTEERAGTFASFNPNLAKEVELADFMSLHLHTAVLAVRRLEHFKSWVMEDFGATRDGFKRVFDSIAGKKSAFKLQEFAEGLQALDYPCGLAAVRSIFTLLDRDFVGTVSWKEFLRLESFSAEGFLIDLGSLKSFAESRYGSLEKCFKQILKCDHAQRKTENPYARFPKLVSIAGFLRFCKDSGFAKVAPDVDGRFLFLFLDEAIGKPADGYLSFQEWSLMKAFDSRALKGCPARLRRILEEEYGSLDDAFQRMHTNWIRGALVRGLAATALAGLGRAVVKGTPPNATSARLAAFRATLRKGVTGHRGDSGGYGGGNAPRRLAHGGASDSALPGLRQGPRRSRANEGALDYSPGHSPVGFASRSGGGGGIRFPAAASFRDVVGTRLPALVPSKGSLPRTKSMPSFGT